MARRVRNIRNVLPYSVCETPVNMVKKARVKVWHTTCPNILTQKQFRTTQGPEKEGRECNLQFRNWYIRRHCSQCSPEGYHAPLEPAEFCCVERWILKEVCSHCLQEEPWMGHILIIIRCYNSASSILHSAPMSFSTQLMWSFIRNWLDDGYLFVSFEKRFPIGWTWRE